MLNVMIIRLFLAFAIFIMIASCTTVETAFAQHGKKKEVLVIYPDGTMKLNGRIMNKEDVVIYPDGHGGERARRAEPNRSARAALQRRRAAARS